MTKARSKAKPPKKQIPARQTKRGRPEFEPTPKQRDRVARCIACNMSEDDTARAIGISTETLRKHFADEIRTARAVRRADAIELLWKTARKGNVSAQKKLIEMTARVEDPAQPKDPAKMGKKDRAEAEAKNAGKGTEWGDDLDTPPTSTATTTPRSKMN